MKIGRLRFNTYLLMLLAVAASCQSTNDKADQEFSTLRLHLEVHPDGTGRNQPVPIFRAKPVLVNVENEPFLDERDVEQAAVVDWQGAFYFQVKFNPHGTLLLDGVTASNPGKHIAIRSQFGGEPRWLAAPITVRRISGGTFTFTPDATLEESKRIARGLNNVAAAIKKKTKH